MYRWCSLALLSKRLKWMPLLLSVLKASHGPILNVIVGSGGHTAHANGNCALGKRLPMRRARRPFPRLRWVWLSLLEDLNTCLVHLQLLHPISLKSCHLSSCLCVHKLIKIPIHINPFIQSSIPLPFLQPYTVIWLLFFPMLLSLQSRYPSQRPKRLHSALANLDFLTLQLFFQLVCPLPLPPPTSSHHAI